MAGSLQSVLAGIPGVGGYEAGRQEDQAIQLGQLQQVGALQGIVGKIAEQQKEQAYRSALAAADTPEKQAAVAMQFGKPSDILGHQDKQATIAATKQTALARLQQASAQNDAMMQFRMGQAKTAEEKAAVAAAHQRFQDQIAAERLKYDTGAVVAVPPMAPPVQAPAGAIPDARGEAPDQATAIQAILANRAQGGRGGTLNLPPAGAVEAPGAAVAPPVAPQPAPEQGAAPAFLGYSGYIPPQNPDTELRRIGGGVPAAAPAPVAAPAAPVAPVMPAFTGSPREVNAAKNKWLQDQAKVSIAGAGRLTPTALTDVAAQYLAGDRQAIAGFARDAATKSAIQNEISKQMRDKGWTGPDVAAQMADFAGIMSGSRTVGTRAAQIELASSEADKMIDIARKQSDKFGRTNFVPVNVAIKAFETNTGQPEVKAFGAAVNSLVNVYARAISPSGVPTVSDKDHAREMLSSVDSPDQFQAVTDVMRQEMRAAREAPGEVRAATRRAVTGAAPAAAGFDADKERRYQEWKARQR